MSGAVWPAIPTHRVVTPGSDTGTYSFSAGLAPPPPAAMGTETPTALLSAFPIKRSDLHSSSDIDMCSLPEVALAPSPSELIMDEAFSRGRWLLGLLILQSTSSFVLDSYKPLLKEHLVVTLFLTMLVGAGGNAGNQSAIKVIRGLATGSIKPSMQSLRNTLQQQAGVGLLLGTGLAAGGFCRVYVSNNSVPYATSISLSLFVIVMTSVLLGTCIPFALAKAGLDPANAGTSIQVCMDILGVSITCGMCQLILMQFASSLPP